MEGKDKWEVHRICIQKTWKKDILFWIYRRIREEYNQMRLREMGYEVWTWLDMMWFSGSFLWHGKET